MDSKSLNIRSYPKLIQEFANENFNLKALCGALLGLMFILLILVVYLVKKGPDVIALDANGQIAKVETRITDVQVREAAENYISYRYQWNSETISSQLKKAELFIDPILVTAYRKSMLDVQKFVKEKKVKQKVYPYDVKVDFKEKKITVIADRITEFDNLKAATAMRLVLSFGIGDRTSINPWGVYINKEAEGAAE
ncbi:hypothetical protein [Bdellovibrio sp.]|uniref:hypothetical protein n=1 Tax=Bdellovibrio sp. TaxID=28201 RepID=UPI0039E28003